MTILEYAFGWFVFLGFIAFSLYAIFSRQHPWDAIKTLYRKLRGQK